MANRDVKEPLMSDDDERYSLEDGWAASMPLRGARQQSSRLKRATLGAFIVLPWILLALLATWTQRSLRECQSRYYVRPDLTYSPVQHVVEYDTVVFNSARKGEPGYSPYAQEPSEEVDELWKGLYPSLRQLIPKEQAAKLVNSTVLFPHDDQRRYVIELDVFHQLHCLNMVRKATRPDYYHQVIREGETEDTLLGPTHVAHCIDQIRQSLMCSSDITPHTWKWREDLQLNWNDIRTPHTCRNFDAIREWARVNTNQVYFDFYYHESNDPLDPSTWIEGYAGD